MTTLSQLRRGLFVDTSAFFALMNRADLHHDDARRIMERAADERLVLVTTNFVIAETHALTLTRLNQQVATRFLQEMEGSGTRVVRAQLRDEATAREIVYRYQDKRFSLTDAISFTVMERLGMGRAFAFDRNFAQFGLEVVR